MTEIIINPLGIPIVGEIVKPGNDHASQRPIEELRPILQAVLDHPEVEAVKWHQYTPYFNDGDPCVFSVYADENFAKLTSFTEEDIADSEYEDGFYEPTDPHIAGGRAQRYVPAVYSSSDKGWPARGTLVKDAYWEPYGPVYEKSSAYDVVNDLYAAINSGEFEDALYDLFGDHAQVTVYKDRIVVNEYRHD